MLANFVDGNDVRVIQPGCGLRFRLETLDVVMGCQHAGTDEFERDHPVQGGLPRFEDCAHAAARNLLDQLVVAEVADFLEVGQSWLSVEG